MSVLTLRVVHEPLKVRKKKKGGGGGGRGTKEKKEEKREEERREEKRRGNETNKGLIEREITSFCMGVPKRKPLLNETLSIFYCSVRVGGVNLGFRTTSFP